MKKNSSAKSLANVIFTSLFRYFAAGVVITLILAVMSQYISIAKTTQENLHNNAKIAADGFSCSISSLKEVTQKIARTPMLTDVNTPNEVKQAALTAMADKHKFSEIHYSPLGSRSYFDKIDYTNKNFYIASSNGQTYISDPVSKYGSDTYVTISTPVWDHLKISGIVWCTLRVQELEEILRSFAGIRKSCVFIVDDDGQVVANNHKGELTFFDTESNINTLQLSSIKSSILSGRSGTDMYFFKTKIHFVAYHPIAETSGWTMIVDTKLDDWLLFNNILLSMLVLCVALILGISWKIYSSELTDLLEPLEVLASKMKNSNLQDFEKIGIEKEYAETNTIFESARNIIGQLNQTMQTHTELSNSLTEIIDKKTISEIFDIYRELYSGITFSAYDKNGKCIIDNIQEGEKISRPILLGERIIGSICASYSDTYSITEKESTRITDSMAKILSSVSKAYYIREINYSFKLTQKNNEIEEYVKISSDVINFLKSISFKTDSIINPDAMNDKEATIIKVNQLTKEFNDKINLKLQQIVLPELNDPVEEGAYTAADLAEKIRSILTGENIADRFEINVENDSSLIRKLFGDSQKIATTVTILADAVSESHSNNHTYIIMKKERMPYSTHLIFEIYCNGDYENSDNFYKMKSILSGNFYSDYSQQNLSQTEQKFITVEKMIKRLNGTISIVEQKNKGMVVTLRIPQLELLK